VVVSFLLLLFKLSYCLPVLLGKLVLYHLSVFYFFFTKIIFLLDLKFITLPGNCPRPLCQLQPTANIQQWLTALCISSDQENLPQ
jgi:hypothetical protein